jgi:hypothetical protein
MSLLWHLANIPKHSTDVRFRGKADIAMIIRQCPLVTQSRHLLRGLQLRRDAISPTHEIPDIVVSTTEALMKCGIFMVSIALGYAIL